MILLKIISSCSKNELLQLLPDFKRLKIFKAIPSINNMSDVIKIVKNRLGKRNLNTK